MIITKSTSGKWVDGKPRVSSMPYTYDITKGNISGHVAWSILGRNDDVDNTLETVWTVGGDYVFPTAGMGMELVSTSDLDSDTGGTNPQSTGVRTVEIHYLDDTWAEQAETVTLDGTAVVTTNATDILRINHVHTATTGTGLKAAGTISLRHLDNTPIYAQIEIGENDDHQAVYTVPLGKTLYITYLQAGIGNQTGNRYGRFDLRVTQEDGAYVANTFFLLNVIDIQDGNAHTRLDFPVKLVAKVDIKANVISDNASANALCSAEFAGWLE